MKKTVEYLNGKDAEKIVNATLKSYSAYSGVVKELMNAGK
jgi:hypothetical protein